MFCLFWRYLTPVHWGGVLFFVCCVDIAPKNMISKVYYTSAQRKSNRLQNFWRPVLDRQMETCVFFAQTRDFGEPYLTPCE